MLMRGSWYSRFDMSFFSFDSVISFFHIYYLLPAAAKEKKGVCGDTPHPGKGLCPLHSCFVRCLRRRKRYGSLGYPSPSKGLCPLHSCFVRAYGTVSSALL